LLTKTD